MHTKVLLNTLALLLLFLTLHSQSPDENHYSLQNRLFGNFHGEKFSGRDVFE